MTDREMLAAIMAKLDGLEKKVDKLEGLTDQVGNLTELATDTDEKMTGLYRHVSGEVAAIREQLERMEAKQDKTAETVAYVIQDVYLLQKKTGGGNR